MRTSRQLINPKVITRLRLKRIFNCILDYRIIRFIDYEATRFPIRSNHRPVYKNAPVIAYFYLINGLVCIKRAGTVMNFDSPTVSMFVRFHNISTFGNLTDNPQFPSVQCLRFSKICQVPKRDAAFRYILFEKS